MTRRTVLPLVVLLAACGAPVTSDQTDATVDDTEVVDTTPDADEDGWTTGEGDCDDGDPEVHPDARDLPYDGLDADCAGDDDDDFDHDGHTATSAGGDDCADADADVHPGATDVPYDGVDADCAGDDDWDADGDGHAATTHFGDDCDDEDAAVYPGAVDTPYDGLDANCDGRNDDDADRDGHVDVGHGGDDCDDTDFLVHPGVVDTPYDGVDANCDGLPDDDLDLDGFVGTFGGGDDCDDQDADVHPDAPDAPYDGVDADCAGDDDDDLDGDGWTGEPRTGPDCDDADPAVYPGATDVPYDGVDADCLADDDFDVDRDGHDAVGFGAGDDCDDEDDTVNPDAAERCDGADDDCDGDVDEPDAVDADLWYPDLDGDDHGAGTAVRSCTAIADHVTVGDDCDDDDGNTFPGAPPHACDGVENDCDTSSLELGTGARVDGTSYPTIAAAILAAPAGGTVEVCEGRHAVGLLMLDKEITVESVYGRDLTQLDGGKASGIFLVDTTDPVVVRGLTLTRGTGVDTRGGALHAHPDATVVLDDLDVRGNEAGSGGGLFFEPRCTVLVTGSEIHDNRADFALGANGLGGGIVLGEDGYLTLVGSHVDANTSTHGGGGLYLVAGAEVHGIDGRVADNTCGLAGGGIYAGNGGNVVEGLTIRDNHTSNAGGGLVARDLDLRDSVVSGNVAGLGGGGVLAYGRLDAQRVTFSANDAGMDGPAIEATAGDALISLVDCSVLGNTGHFGTRGSVGTGLVPWGEVHLRGGALESLATDWGDFGADATPDVGLELTGEPVYEYVGAQSFFCDDTTRFGCH